MRNLSLLSNLVLIEFQSKFDLDFSAQRKEKLNSKFVVFIFRVENEIILLTN